MSRILEVVSRTLNSWIVFNRNPKDNLTVSDGQKIILDINGVYNRIDTIIEDSREYANNTKTITADYTLLPTDDTIECIGTFTVTLYPISSSFQYQQNISNTGVGIITINTASVTELIYDTPTFELRPAENITLQTGINWVVK